MLLRALLTTLLSLHVSSANADLRKCFSNEELNSTIHVENRNTLHNLVKFVLFANFSADGNPVAQDYIPYLIYTLFLHIHKPNDENSKETIELLEAIKANNGPKSLFADGGEKELENAIACVSDEAEDCATVLFKSGSLVSLNQLSKQPEFEEFFSAMSDVCFDSFIERK